jgi:hypothetical protein
VARPNWGPGEVQTYEETGTTTDVTTCNFCGARGLAETVVLLVHTVDGELAGSTYACDPCAAEAVNRATQKRGRGSWRDDPRLRGRNR